MAFQYLIYGLRLRSNRAISGLLPASQLGDFSLESRVEHQPALVEQADVVVAFDAPLGQEEESRRYWLHSAPDVSELAFDFQENRVPTEAGVVTNLRFALGPAWVEFLLSPTGESIQVSWGKAMPFQSLNALLIGPVLGRLLRIRGEVCLHANALQVGQRAIAVVGGKGTGKSTTTAALLQAGCPVLADDVVTLRPKDNAFWVFPGHPALRLCPDAIEALFSSDAELQPIWAYMDGYPLKQYLRLKADVDSGGTFGTAPLPLGTIYLLERRESDRSKPSIEAVSAQEALLSLVQNTFANHTLDARQRAQEFAVLGALLKQVSVRRVRRPDNLKLLPEVACLIRDDAQILCASAER